MKFSDTQAACELEVARRAIVSLTSAMNFCASAVVGVPAAPPVMPDGVHADAVTSTNKTIPSDRIRLPFEKALWLFELRPAQTSAADDVKMEMIHGLSRLGIDIEHRAVALLVDAGLLRQLFGDLKHMREKRGVFFMHVVESRNVFARADQKMHGTLRPDIFERDDEFVLIDDLRRRFAPDDATEEA